MARVAKKGLISAIPAIFVFSSQQQSTIVVAIDAALHVSSGARPVQTRPRSRPGRALKAGSRLRNSSSPSGSVSMQRDAVANHAELFN